MYLLGLSFILHPAWVEQSLRFFFFGINQSWLRTNSFTHYNSTLHQITSYSKFQTVHQITSLGVSLFITNIQPQKKVKSTPLINTEKLTQCCHVGQRFWSYWTLRLCDPAVTTCSGEMVVWWRWRSCFLGIFWSWAKCAVKTWRYGEFQRLMHQDKDKHFLVKRWTTHSCKSCQLIFYLTTKRLRFAPTWCAQSTHAGQLSHQSCRRQSLRAVRPQRHFSLLGPGRSGGGWEAWQDENMWQPRWYLGSVFCQISIHSS